MKLDQKKLNRQIRCFNAALKLFADPIQVLIGGVMKPIRAAIIEAATGFGKTFIAIMTIKDMNQRKPDRTSIVVVPTTKLYDDWTRKEPVYNAKGEMILEVGHILKHGLQNVRVFVVNTYVKYVNYSCDLLILDEAHHYASVDADKFNKVITITNFRFGLALSATLNKAQKEFFFKHGWRIADVVTPEECEEEGYTSTSIIFNLGIPLSEADKAFNEKINEDFNNIFKKFDFEFELMQACNVGADVQVSVKLKNQTYLGKKTGKEWRAWLAKQRGWDGKDPKYQWHPENINRYAAMGMFYMRKRKDKWQNMPSKLIYVEQIIKKFAHLKTLIFSETGDFADQIAALFPESCLAYHTKLPSLATKGNHVIENPKREQLKLLRQQGYVMKSKQKRKKEALELFVDPKSKINQISAVRALDEGVDVPKVEVVVQTAYNSTNRQDTQRSGRGKRIDYENLFKKALLINLYMINTQEEKWCRAKQLGLKRVRWVESVDDIVINQKISLYAEPAEVPAVETGIVNGADGQGSSPDSTES